MVLVGGPVIDLQTDIAAGRDAGSLIRVARRRKSLILNHSLGVRPPGGAALPLPV